MSVELSTGNRLSLIFSYTKNQKQSHSIITYGPLKVCGSVISYRDPALSLYFINFLLFWWVQDAQGTAPVIEAKKT